MHSGRQSQPWDDGVQGQLYQAQMGREEDEVSYEEHALGDLARNRAGSPPHHVLDRYAQGGDELAVYSAPEETYQAVPGMYPYVQHVPWAHYDPTTSYPTYTATTSQTTHPPDPISISTNTDHPQIFPQPSSSTSTPYHPSPIPPQSHLPIFPTWNRQWYSGELSSDGHAYTRVRPDGSGWETASHSLEGGHAAREVGRGGERGGSFTDEERRMIKAQRIKMLEKEFGKPKVWHRRRSAAVESSVNGDAEEGEAIDAVDENVEGDEAAPTPLGGIRSNGRLNLPYRKTINCLRWTFLLCSLSSTLLAILAIAVISPGSIDSPIPAIRSNWTSWLFHGIACTSSVLLIWLFFCKGGLCDPARRAVKDPSSSQGQGYAALGMGGGGGGMGQVIPVMTSNGNTKESNDRRGLFGRRRRGERNKRGRFGNNTPNGAIPTINVIVDPSLFPTAHQHQALRGEDLSSSSDSSQEEDDLQEEGGETSEPLRPARPGGLQVTHEVDDFDSFTRSFQAHKAARSRAKRRRRRKRRLARSPAALQRAYLARIHRQHVHSLALSSLQSILCWSLLVLFLQLVGMILVFGFSSGQGTNCQSPGSSWCDVWRGELASVILAFLFGCTWEILAWIGWRVAKREGQRDQSAVV